MTTLFISDLHLEEDRPDITQAFLNFLDTRAKTAQALYILGDLFEVWIGDDGMDSYQQHIAQALRRLADGGTQIFLLHGNRDFMLGKAFCRLAGCQLLKEESLIQLGGEPVLLMHGDTLCTQDYRYQRQRWRLRNPVSIWLLRHLPLSTRHKLARQLREASRRYTREQPSAIVDVTDDAVVRRMSHHGVRTLIHGHTHRPAIHSVQLNGSSAQRIVLGDWDKQGWFLAFDEQQGYALQTLALLAP